MIIAKNTAKQNLAWAADMTAARRDALPLAVLDADGVRIYHVKEGHAARVGSDFVDNPPPGAFGTGAMQTPFLGRKSSVHADRPWRPGDTTGDLIEDQLSEPTVDINSYTGDVIRTVGSFAGHRPAPLSVAQTSGLEFLIQGGTLRGTVWNLGQNLTVNVGRLCPNGGTVVIGVEDITAAELPFSVKVYPAASYSAPLTYRQTSRYLEDQPADLQFTPLVSISYDHRSGAWSVLGYNNPDPLG